MSYFNLLLRIINIITKTQNRLSHVLYFRFKFQNKKVNAAALIIIVLTVEYILNHNEQASLAGYKEMILLNSKKIRKLDISFINNITTVIDS